MERRRIRRNTPKNRIEGNSKPFRKITSQSDQFFKKPIVKKITKTVVISGAVFGLIYISRYFLSATADMITSCKKIRDAWRA